MTYYVIAIFECGCDYESSYSSTEMVECNSLKEVDDVKDKYDVHSIDYQCTPFGCSGLIVIDGLVDNPNVMVSEGIGRYPYREFVKAWGRMRQDHLRSFRETIKHQIEMGKEMGDDGYLSDITIETEAKYKELKSWKSLEFKEEQKELLRKHEDVVMQND